MVKLLATVFKKWRLNRELKRLTAALHYLENYVAIQASLGRSVTQPPDWVVEGIPKAWAQFDLVMSELIHTRLAELRK